jgi:hypothetical protein
VNPLSAQRSSSARGVTLVEAIICVLLVSGIFVATMHTVSASGLIQFHAAHRARGQHLASALMAEVLLQAYDPPSDPSARQQLLDPGLLDLLGDDDGSHLRGGGGGDRTGFDDVDDYAGYADAPPVERDGSMVPGADGYERTVAVTLVAPADLTPTSTDSGLKLVTVMVRRGGKTVARVSALKARLE